MTAFQTAFASDPKSGDACRTAEGPQTPETSADSHAEACPDAVVQTVVSGAVPETVEGTSLPVQIETNRVVAQDLATAVETNRVLVETLSPVWPEVAVTGPVPEVAVTGPALEVAMTETRPETVEGTSLPAQIETNRVVAQDLAMAVETNRVVMETLAPVRPATVVTGAVPEVVVTEGLPEVVEGTSLPAQIETNRVVAQDLATAVETNRVVVETLAPVRPEVAVKGAVPETVVGAPLPVQIETNRVVAQDLVTAVEANTASLTRIATTIPLEVAVAANGELERELTGMYPLTLPGQSVDAEGPALQEKDGAEARPSADGVWGAEETVEDGESSNEPVAVVQAAPGTVPPEALQAVPVDAPAVRVQEVEVASARAAVVAPEQMLMEVAGTVAETLLVTPGLLRGQGEVVIQLRPDVLEGTEVRIAVTGRELEVVFEPRTVDMSVLIERCRPQLAECLAARIHAFNIAVQVRPNMAGGRSARVRDEERV